MSAERLRHYLNHTGVAARVGRRWVIGADNRRRIMPVYSSGAAIEITVPDYGSARLIGEYMSAVGQALADNDPAPLQPFVGVSVTDVNGKSYLLETDLNALYRLQAAGGEPFDEVYKIIG